MRDSQISLFLTLGLTFLTFTGGDKDEESSLPEAMAGVKMSGGEDITEARSPAGAEVGMSAGTEAGFEAGVEALEKRMVSGVAHSESK